MTEPHLRYVLPDGQSAAGVGDILARHLDVEPTGTRRWRRTLLDSFDGRLRRAGYVLFHEDGRLVLAGDDGEVAGQARSRAGDPLLASELERGPMRTRLEPLLGVRAAAPIARLRADRRELRVLDGARKTVVRMAIVRAAAGRGRGWHPLRPRLELAGVRGYDKALVRVRSVVEDELGLAATADTLYDEAVLAAGGTPGGFSPKVTVDIAANARADAAAVAVLRPLIASIDANLPGTLADVDTEFLHDLRVAVRRTRALQRELRGVFPPGELARFRAAFKRLQQVTGPTRDLDVQLLEFDEVAAFVAPARRAELEPLRELLAARRGREWTRMTRALRARTTRDMLAEWARFVDRLEALPADDRPDAAVPVGDLAARRIARVYRHMVRMGRRIDDDSPSEALHDLRKKGKELRYLLEFFSALFPEATVAPMVKTLKALQDALGRFQDREIQVHALRSLGDDVASLDDGAHALMAMGVLAERLEHQQAQARAEFASRFAPFAAKAQRAAVKETFG